MAGGIVSRTMTLKVLTLLLHKASSAVHVTRLVPRAKTEPEVGLQVTSTFGWHKFVANVENVTTVPVGPAHSATTLEGETMAGNGPASLMTQKSPPPSFVAGL